MKKPYLMSIGFGFPSLGIWGHKYVDVRKKRRMGSRSFLGFRVIWATYKKVDDPGVYDRIR